MTPGATPEPCRSVLDIPTSSTISSSSVVSIANCKFLVPTRYLPDWLVSTCRVCTCAHVALLWNSIHSSSLRDPRGVIYRLETSMRPDVGMLLTLPKSAGHSRHRPSAWACLWWVNSPIRLLRAAPRSFGARMCIERSTATSNLRANCNKWWSTDHRYLIR